MRFDKLTIARAATILLAAGLLLVGPVALLFPGFAGDLFGVAAQRPETLAYLHATAARDVAFGCLLLALVALRSPRRTLAAALAVSAIIPTFDVLVVLSYPVSRGFPLFVHGSSAVALYALAAWLWVGKD